MRYVIHVDRDLCRTIRLKEPLHLNKNNWFDKINGL